MKRLYKIRWWNSGAPKNPVTPLNFNILLLSISGQNFWDLLRRRILLKLSGDNRQTAAHLFTTVIICFPLYYILIYCSILKISAILKHNKTITEMFFPAEAGLAAYRENFNIPTIIFFKWIMKTKKWIMKNWIISFSIEI